MFRVLASNTFSQVVARIISSGVSFLITLLIAKSYSITVYGDFAKVIALISLFYLIIDFGLNPVFLQKTDNKKRFKELLFGRLSLASLLFIGVNLFASLLPYNSHTHVGFSPLLRLPILVFSLTFFTEGILYSALAVFQRELSYKYLLYATSIGSLITLLVVYLGTLFTHSLLLIFVGFFLGGLGESIFALLFTKEQLVPIIIQTRFTRRLFIETAPLTLMLICNMLYFRIDMLILGSLRPSQDVAVYDIAYKFFDFLIALPLFVSNVLYPILIKHERENTSEKKEVLRYVGVYLLFSLVIFFPLWFGAPLLQYIKPQFLAAVLPFRLLLLSLPVFFGTSVLQWVLIAKQKQRFLVYVYVAALIGNVALNIHYIPQDGYIAASIITGASEALVFLLFCVRLFVWDKGIWKTKLL